MEESSKRIGRPTKAAVPGKRVSLGLKVTSDIKKRLDSAARVSGRTQSQEAEARLERSFDHQELLPQVLALAYGSQLAAMLLMLGDAMKATGESAGVSATADRRSTTLERTQKWFDMPYAYDQAVRAADRILEALRPAGASQHMRDTEAELHLGDVEDQLGERVAASVLIEATSGRSRIGSDDQERARTYHRMLGHLTKRLKDTAVLVASSTGGRDYTNEG